MLSADQFPHFYIVKLTHASVDRIHEGGVDIPGLEKIFIVLFEEEYTGALHMDSTSHPSEYPDIFEPGALEVSADVYMDALRILGESADFDNIPIVNTDERLKSAWWVMTPLERRILAIAKVSRISARRKMRMDAAKRRLSHK